MVKSQGVRLLQWNCDGLVTKRDKLQELLRKQRIDVACIQETKLLLGDRTPYLEGYNMVRRDRPGVVREREGGLAFIVRKGVGYWISKIDHLQIVEADTLNLYGTGGRILRIVNTYIP